MFTYSENGFTISGMGKFKDLSGVLNYLIESNGLSQTALANKTGIPQSTISRAVSKTHASMRVDYLAKLAKFFNITVGQLVGAEDLENGIPKSAIQSIDWKLFFSISRPLEENIKKQNIPLSDSDISLIIEDLYIKAQALGKDASNSVIQMLIDTKLENISN